MTECRLCGEKTKLVKSHIIPKSLYGDVLQLNEPMWIVGTSKDFRTQFSQNGIWDAKILCMSCERKLSPLDDYADKLFMKTKPKEHNLSTSEIPVWEYTDVDIVKLRLFFISLVWRMHVATHPVFAAVQIGNIYEEKFKQALIKLDYSAPFAEIDVLVTKFTDDLKGYLLAPMRSKMRGINMYSVNCASHVFLIKVDQRPFSFPCNLMSLSAANPLLIISREFSDSHEMTIVRKIMKDNKMILEEIDRQAGNKPS